MEKYMTPLSEVIAELRKRGYVKDFNLRNDCIYCAGGTETLLPDDFHIDRVYRFEGDSDPADQAVLYAITSEKFGLKGILVNGYGISADQLTEAMICKLATH